MTMLCLRRIRKHYAKAVAPALAGVDFQLARGECVAITGSSGAGKTTLLHVIGGLLAADEGMVEIDGKQPWQGSHSHAARFRRRNLGMLLQGAHLLDELDVETNVALPLMLDRRRDARAVARAQLDAFGLSMLAQQRPPELSGGEAVRVALARALVAAPLLLLADEPTCNLDPENAQHVCALLQKAARAGTAVLLVTHDRNLAATADRQLRLDDGRLS